jgi:ferritin
MINKTLQNAINSQIQAEMFSSYLYLAMSNYCESKNFKGTAQWFLTQSKEEWEHAMKFYKFLLDRGGSVTLKTIEAPQQDFKSILDAFETTLEHEKKVTSLINKLYELSLKEKDYPTQILLQWFITEQVEEEANAVSIIEKLKAIGEKGGSIFWLDKELGKRGKS